MTPVRPEVLAAMRVMAKQRGDLRFSKYRDDPVGFITAILREWPWSKQREIAESVRDNRHTAVQSAHDTGKSFIASRIAAWWLSVFPPGEAFVVTSAPTFAQVRAILWREINRAHSKGNLPGRVNQTEWHIGNEIVAYGRKPADYDESAFQGIHARHVLVILDEAGGIPKQLWDAAETLTTNEGCRVLAIGNPDSPLTEFKRVCDAGTGWNVIHVDGYESPNFTDEEVPDDIRPLLISPMWVEERKQAWGEDSPIFISKVRGRFPLVPKGQVHKWLTPTRQWYGPLPRFKRVVGGLDFGGANPEAHKTAGVAAGIVAAGQQSPENSLIRFAHFEHAGPKVHDQLLEWMAHAEQQAGRHIIWRADKSQSFGISLAKRLFADVVPSQGGADSVWNGIVAQQRGGEDGMSYFTEELLEVPMLNGDRLNGLSWYAAMTKYRWAEQPDEDKQVPGVPIKRDDDTADADRYMVEEADGFPTAVMSMPKTNTAGKPLARYAV